MHLLANKGLSCTFLQSGGFEEVDPSFLILKPHRILSRNDTVRYNKAVSVENGKSSSCLVVSKLCKLILGQVRFVVALKKEWLEKRPQLHFPYLLWCTQFSDLSRYSTYIF